MLAVICIKIICWGEMGRDINETELRIELVVEIG